MSRTASVGGFTFGSPPVTDVDGVRWTLTGLDGWDNSGAGVRRDSQDRPQQHGAFSAPGFRTGRSVAFSGLVECPTRAIAAGIKADLAALLADGSDATFTVVDTDEATTSATVGLADLPDVGWSHDRGASVLCAFELFAPDPFRYAAATPATKGFAQMLGGLEFDLFTDGTTDTGMLEFGDPGTETGIVATSNTGTAPAWPSFVVVGPTPPEGFDLVDSATGSRLRYTGQVPSGSTLTIDSATGLVTLDGVDRRTSLVIREWFSVAPGGTSSVLFSPLGGPTSALLTVTVPPTFW